MDGLKHPKHDDQLPSHKIYEQGLAVGSTDIRNGVWYFRYYDELYTVPGPIQVEKKKFPQFKEEMCVAPIEKVRFAAHG